jgi:hypothetical protein
MKITKIQFPTRKDFAEEMAYGIVGGTESLPYFRSLALDAYKALDAGRDSAKALALETEAEAAKELRERFSDLREKALELLEVLRLADDLYGEAMREQAATYAE